MAIAPLACISFRQQASEMLRYHGIVADRAAQRVVSLPDFSWSAAANIPGVVDAHSCLLVNVGKLTLPTTTSTVFFAKSVQEVLVVFLMAIFGGVCERAFV